MTDAESKLRNVLARSYGHSFTDGPYMDGIVASWLRDALVSKMLSTRPRVLSDDELTALCAVRDTRLRPADVSAPAYTGEPRSKYSGPFFLGFAAYYDNERNHYGPEIQRRELIDKFWDAACDDVLRQAVAEHGFHVFGFLCERFRATRTIGLWGPHKAAEFLKLALDIQLTDWHIRSSGPGWQSDIAYYATARAERLSFPFQHYVRRCLYCGEEFNDADIRPALLREVGYMYGFCEPCLALACQFGGAKVIKQAVFPTGRAYLEQTLRVLSKVLGVPVPAGHSDAWLSARYLLYATAAIRTGRGDGNAIVAALVPMQPIELYEDVIGLDALVATGMLRPERTAADGHRCDCIEEEIIDDWLWRHGIPHERPAYYPRSQGTGPPARADWAVGGALVEHWSQEGERRYDARSETKRSIAKASGVRLIEIHPEELTDLDAALTEKFAQWLPEGRR